ncbi:GPI ethanolamine phosphate transferase 2 isoform X1 [Phyllopteryx taeniolatus]|uniref:GPI ethanolamine phosphate transferase 2 isoform X1 n=2 Tax=Phyllopteryx taeniolatus TaxID=161469 RepID=UPI002AD39682|nr:GPI ethanolamine phosphate transferase 2 isoform X1 [Phyllopteryx taeniolatus]XP_061642843.1 GPI ethanolamine phosphate transferase 2 isoform X1 [Phyllopteryx taeniolatus]XP_061642844.1 GPI ethanolamine phosphate transferase 2 isoform X1 [Phyllopteryx taeniolatus]XP_061642845.1 GPI ethanolamine phosphate transferase 2 isoform X1 [Phyllopteryx taeniolatus]
MKVRSSAFASFILMFEVLGVALFLRGFFPAPVKSLSSKGSLEDLPAEPLSGGSPNASYIPRPLFGRLVIMLIDAMREDYVFGANGRVHMPYTRHLVERGSALSFVAKARSPTVTMPRIKALTTGSIPGFIDVLMNLNSPALLEDNLIWQAKTAGKKMIFYGDETWVRLFPKHFMEYDGTLSFVSDYTEADNNVTRHLDSTLKRDDWDILILHYLGLDHIGHISGPRSSLIQPKLLEMDDILKKIHGFLISKEAEGSLPYLLVLCADHGMSETGSHGGSSEPEVNTPLVLISPAFKRKVGMEKPDEVEQVDLTPTLALSLGLPISQNSVGRVIQSVFEETSLRDQLRFLHLNGHQLNSLLKDSIPDYEKEAGFEQYRVAEKAHGSWMKRYLEGNMSEVLTNMGKKVLKQYFEALSTMSSALSKQLGKYDVYSMIAGMVFVFQLLLVLLLAMPEALSGSASVDLPVISALLSLPFYLLCLLLASVHVLVCTSTESSCYFCSLSWGLVFAAIAFSSAMSCLMLYMMTRRLPLGLKLYGKSPLKSSSSEWSLSELDVLLLVGTAGHTLSLASSSFIEEEHQTWYFLLNTLCLVVFQDVCCKYFREKSGPGGEEEHVLPYKDYHKEEMYPEKWLALATPPFVLLCCRLLRYLNQTGMQWAHLPDLGHWLNSSEHKVVLSLLSAFSLVLIYFLIQRRCSLVSKIALALGLLGVYSYRAAVGNVLFPWQHSGRSMSKGTVEARFVYVFVLGILFTGTKDLLRSQIITPDAKLKNRGLWEIYSGLVLLVSLLFRAHNLPVLCCCLLIQTLMAQFIWKKLHYDAAQTTIMHYWFGQAFFYFQGNSNNISTVDISVWFVGFDNFVEAPAIFLTAVSTYAGPLLWACHLVCYLSSERNRSPVAVGHGCYCLAVLRSVPVAAYIVLVTVLRYHLFIWSVFSPKLLYEAMHLLLTAGVCLIFNTVEQSHTSASS